MTNGASISRREAMKQLLVGLGTLSLPADTFLTSSELLHAQAPSLDSLRMLNTVDRYVERMLERFHIPGASIGILKEGKVVLTKGYGKADLEHDVSATEKTLYPIASITKSFTATAIMMLVEAGDLKLDDNIVKYLSGLPKSWSDVTIVHCLGHTSGIENFAPHTRNEQVSEITEAGLFERIVHDYKELLFPPGAGWRYSSSAYFLLSQILEQISGESYSSFLQKRIFQPLKMHSTRINDEKEIVRGRARGYVWDSNRLENAKVIDQSWPYGSGNIISNVVDLANWCQALRINIILSQNSFQQMWTPHLLNNGKPETLSENHHYGLGWDLINHNGHLSVGHGGIFPGAGACLSHFPQLDVSVIVLQNEECIGDSYDIHPARLMAFKLAGMSDSALALPRKEPLNDHSPEVTKLGRSFLLKVSEGQSVKGMCSKKYLPKVESGELLRYSRFFKEIAPCQSIALVDRQNQGKSTVDRYQMSFSSFVYQVRLAFGPSGKVENLSVDGEVIT